MINDNLYLNTNHRVGYTCSKHWTLLEEGWDHATSIQNNREFSKVREIFEAGRANSGLHERRREEKR